MTVSAGEIVYRLGKAPSSGLGLRWSDGELNDAMDGRISEVLFDDEGKANVEGILANLVETDFALEGLRRVLKDPEMIEDWRVGEALAETYLTEHRSCSFPWPDGRDVRKSGSSLPGADLVGFGVDEDGDCLAFGEVKTSSEQVYPPSAMYGRTGLKQQLEDLRDEEAVRDDLVRYLGFRAGSAPWRTRFERAAIRYLRNSSDIQLYGCLIRDVEANRDDLRARVGKLAVACPEKTRIEVLALYLPPECLDGIGEEMVSRRQEGGKQ